VETPIFFIKVIQREDGGDASDPWKSLKREKYPEG
jgi:hypothetical protein